MRRNESSQSHSSSSHHHHHHHQQQQQAMKGSNSNTDEEEYGSFYTTNPIRSASSISSGSSGAAGGGGGRNERNERDRGDRYSKYRDYSPNRRHHHQHHQQQQTGAIVDPYSVPQIGGSGNGSDRGSERSSSSSSRAIYARPSTGNTASVVAAAAAGGASYANSSDYAHLPSLPPPCCHQYYHHNPVGGANIVGSQQPSSASSHHHSPLHFNTIPHPPLQYRDAPNCSTLNTRSSNCYNRRHPSQAPQSSPFTTYYATASESPYADPRNEIYYTSTLSRHPIRSSMQHHRYNPILVDNSSSPNSSTILEGIKAYEPPPPPIGYQSSTSSMMSHHHPSHHHSSNQHHPSMRSYIGFSPNNSHQQHGSNQSQSQLRLDEPRIYSSSALQLGSAVGAGSTILRSNSPPPLPAHHPHSSSSSASGHHHHQQHHSHHPPFIDRSISLIRLDNSGILGASGGAAGGIDSNTSMGTRIKFITDIQHSPASSVTSNQQQQPSNNSNNAMISSTCSLVKTTIELGSSSDPLGTNSSNITQITPVKPKFKITDITPLSNMTLITNKSQQQSHGNSSSANSQQQAPIVEMSDKGVMTTQLPEQWSLVSSAGSNSGSDREQQQSSSMQQGSAQQRRISLGGTVSSSGNSGPSSLAAPNLCNSGGIPDLLPTSCIVRHSGGDYGPSAWRNSGNNLLTSSPRRSYHGSGLNAGGGCPSGSGNGNNGFRNQSGVGGSGYSGRGIPKHLSGGGMSGNMTDGTMASNYHQYQHRHHHANSKWDIVKQYMRNEMKTFFGLEGGEDLKDEWLSRRKRFASRRYSERNVDSMPPPSPYQPTLDFGGHDQADSGAGRGGPPRMDYHHRVHHPRPTIPTGSTSRGSVNQRSRRTRKKDHVFVVYWNLIRWLFWTLRFGRTGQRVAAGAGCGSDTNPGAGSTTPSGIVIAAGRVPLDSQMSRNRTKSRSITPSTLSELPPNVTISPQELFFDDLDDNPRNSSHQLQPPGRGLHWRIARHQSGSNNLLGNAGIGILISNRVSTQLLSRILDNSERQQFRQGLRQPTSTITNKLALIDEYEDFRPYFTYWVSIVQVIILIVSMITYGLAPVGFDLHRKSSLVLVTSLSLQQMEIVQPANFWIGPSAGDLIHLGAKYAPCMRRDDKIYRRIMETRDSERQTACCIRNDNSGCVQSSRNECSGLLSTWKKWTGKEVPGGRISGSVCGLDPKFCEAPASIAPYEWPDDITKWPICRKTRGLGGMSIKDKTAEHMVCEVIGHPCCIGIHARCVITTREYCRFVSGYFHEEASLCSQVSCLQDVCGMFPFLAYESPDQFYRLFSSLFLHAGLIHICFTLLFHWFILRDLEKLAGPLRISIIYLGSGFAGNLGSVLLEPHRAEVGPGGGQYGLIACLLVELLHMWGMLRRPWQALGKMVIVTCGLFLLGFLPWVDNFAHVVGFAAGFLLSHALMPYIVFGKYSSYRKWLEVLVCFGGFFTILVTLLIVFYAGFGDCEMCRLFNCLPFTQEFCAEQEIDLKPSGTGINFIT